MSRSNPTESFSNNPATRFIEWTGEEGSLRYYDKATKQNVSMGDKFVFILLDQLGTIKGWHDGSSSGIYSNEVKDTRQQPFVVKAFKGGLLAEGIYANIKDRIGNCGGYFTANLYIAFKLDNKLTIGSLQFKGAALREWMDFSKQSRSELYTKAVSIDGFKEGLKGKVRFRTPQFRLKDITPETNQEAVALDKQLQTYLKAYLSRPTAERAAVPPTDEPEEPPQSARYGDGANIPAEDDIPF